MWRKYLVNPKTPQYALGPALFILKLGSAEGSWEYHFLFCLVLFQLMRKMNLLISLELEREEVALGWEALLLPSTGQRRK